MIKSIQKFQSEGVKNLEKIMVDYSVDMTKIAEMIQGVTKGVVDLGLSIIAEEWEFYDEILRDRKELRSEWYIVRRDETTLLTSLGSVTYHKTLFKNKFTGEHEYLLDRIMGIEKHARMTEDAEAKLLEEAVQTSYRKGGESASISSEVVSKETVMNKIHTLTFPCVEPQAEKKALKYLYIDADEDHVSLQYINEKRERDLSPAESWYHIAEGWCDFRQWEMGDHIKLRDISGRKEDPVLESGREEKGGRVILPTGDSAYSSV